MSEDEGVTRTGYRFRKATRLARWVRRTFTRSKCGCSCRTCRTYCGACTRMCERLR